MRKKVLTAILCGLFALVVRAQNKEVTGSVTDSTGAPLAGASINVKGVRGGTSAGQDGSFHLSVPANATLVISAIGYDPLEIRVGSTANFNLQLKQSGRSLNVVVVTGIGVATSRKKTPLDIASLTSKDVAKSATGSVEQALVGKIAGAQVQFNSGTPGSGATIILRGLNSLGDSYPLIL